MLELLNVCQNPARLWIVVCVQAKRILDIRLWVCNLFSHNKLINTHSHAHMHKVNPFLWVNNGRPEISSQKARHQPPNNTYTLTLWLATQSSELSVCVSLSFSLSLCLSPLSQLNSIWASWEGGLSADNLISICASSEKEWLKQAEEALACPGLSGVLIACVIVRTSPLPATPLSLPLSPSLLLCGACLGLLSTFPVLSGFELLSVWRWIGEWLYCWEERKHRKR